MGPDLRKVQDLRCSIDSDGCETLRNRILPSYTPLVLSTGFHVEQAFPGHSEHRDMNLRYIAEDAYHTREGPCKSVPGSRPASLIWLKLLAFVDLRHSVRRRCSITLETDIDVM